MRFLLIVSCLIFFALWCSYEAGKLEQNDLTHALRVACEEATLRDPTPIKSTCENIEIIRCSICWENVPNILLLPCLHQCVCGDCQLYIDQCPICRRELLYKLVCIIS